MKLKVCGITSLEQLQQLQDLNVDFAGLIFYERSKRVVGDKLENQKWEIKNLKIKKVGVFVNAEIAEIKKTIDEYGLNFVQLHGEETPEACEKIQGFTSVIKAIQIGSGANLDEQLASYENSCDYFLFDTASKQYGGTGLQFDWQKLEEANFSKPFFLSGGIGLEDIEKIKTFQHPKLFAIDVNSRFETRPGVKDLGQVASFVKLLK
jgi:phosphoribosylanthranilate isomerase